MEKTKELKHTVIIKTKHKAVARIRTFSMLSLAENLRNDLNENVIDNDLYYADIESEEA